MQALARLIPSRIAIEVSGAVVAWLAMIIVLAAVDSGPAGGSKMALFGPDAGYATAIGSGSGSAIALATYFVVANAGAAVLAIRLRDPALPATGCLRRSCPDVCPRSSSDYLGRRRASSRSPTLAASCSGTLSKRQ